MLEIELASPQTGFISSLEAEGVGRACIALGGGREKKDSEIDLSVGVVLKKKVGDYVERGESLLTIFARDEKPAKEVEKLLLACYEFSDNAPQKSKFIKGIIR